MEIALVIAVIVVIALFVIGAYSFCSAFYIQGHMKGRRDGYVRCLQDFTDEAARAYRSVSSEENRKRLVHLEGLLAAWKSLR